MFDHITKAVDAKKFFEACGITISDESAYNAVTLINDSTNEKITLWAESFFDSAGGIPGIFIETIDKKD